MDCIRYASTMANSLFQDNRRALLMLSCLALLLSAANGHASYQALIPNGDSVPDPCDPDVLWPGVGHEAREGGGPRNVFGEAFEAAGLAWTSELCNADSDGDGLSNGQELGDPNCVWQTGDTPENTEGISHPGYPQCENSSPTNFRKGDVVWLITSCLLLPMAWLTFF